MMLEQLAYIAEIVGVVVVAATLIFLTIQLRQNTSMLRSAATQMAHSQFAQIYEPFFEDVSFLNLFLRAADDISSLSAEEVARLNAYWMHGTVCVQNWFFQTRERAMDVEILNSYSKLMQRFIHAEIWQQFWTDRREVFAPEFVSWVDDVVAKAPSKPYRPLGVPTSEDGKGSH